MAVQAWIVHSTGLMLRRMKVEDVFTRLLGTLTTGLEGLPALLAEDAVVEFPYAPSAGRPGRVEGREAIVRHFAWVMSNVGFRNFALSNMRAHPGADPETAWFEFHGTADLPGGKHYEQDYVVSLRARDGKVIHYREYWNMIAILGLGA